MPLCKSYDLGWQAFRWIWCFAFFQDSYGLHRNLIGIYHQIGDNRDMICVVKTTNLARLTYLKSVLDSADVPFAVFDEHISALEAGIGAFPRRLMVPSSYEGVAKGLLADVEELYDD